MVAPAPSAPATKWSVPTAGVCDVSVLACWLCTVPNVGTSSTMLTDSVPVAFWPSWSVSETARFSNRL
ncbi:hypothetical protein, partial [Mesorhizobium sp. M0772]